MSQADLTVEQGKATCPMSPSGLLKETGPMSPSQFQRPFFSGELKLGSSVGAWEEALVFILQGRGVARLVGGGSWIAGARRWRVASLREGPLRLDLHLEVRLHSSSLRGVARRRARRHGECPRGFNLVLGAESHPKIPAGAIN
ncbi:hypothetical protein Taro_043528, partial [Colocasia esculenta]|nr:hypothetical protein [Colocasia esculenta]